MATATAQLQGTYVLDPIHSSASFAVKHMVVSTFRGRFEKFDAKLDRRQADRHRRRRLDRRQGREPGRAPAVARVLRRRAPPRAALRVERDPPGDGDEVVVDGELTIKGITKAVEARGTIEGPAVTFGDVNKVGLTLEAIIDRTEFGLNWNAPLPKGGFALANDVKLIVELELAEQA